nr:MAG TPA: hypothetical protein [Bacteriophage sp.]
MCKSFPASSIVAQHSVEVFLSEVVVFSVSFELIKVQHRPILFLLLEPKSRITHPA